MILWLTAQKGNTQMFVPEQNVHLFYGIEDLIWSQSLIRSVLLKSKHKGSLTEDGWI